MTKTDREPQLISHSTILILSGFLVGMTIGKIVSDELSPYVMLTGVLGFFAFFVFDLSAARRAEATLRHERNLMEERLAKHTNSLAPTSVDEGTDNGDSPATNAAKLTAAQDFPTKEREPVGQEAMIS